MSHAFNIRTIESVHKEFFQNTDQHVTTPISGNWAIFEFANQYNIF